MISDNDDSENSAKEDVATLNRVQTEAMEKYGYTRDQIANLSTAQIDILYLLRNFSITTKLLLENPWLNRNAHACALAYLVQIRAYPLDEALQALAHLNEDAAYGVSKGLLPNEVHTLKDYQIEFLHTKFSFNKINNADITSLSEQQLTFLKHTAYLGVTPTLLLKYPKIDTDTHHRTLAVLCLFRRMGIEQSFKELDNLEPFQLEGLAKGLSKAEMMPLNQAQVEALIEARTVTNRLCTEDFIGKDWFNTQEHVRALVTLLSQQKMSVQTALQELDGLSGLQATQIANGEKRDNIVGLNEWQLQIVKDFKYGANAIPGSQLRGKVWLNSGSHYLAFRYLIKNPMISLTKSQGVTRTSEYYLTPSEALAILDGMDLASVKLIPKGYTRDQILALTPYQRKIMSELEYLDNRGRAEILEATWIDSDKHVQAFLALNNNYRYRGQELQILKYAHGQEGGLDELLKRCNGSDDLNIPASFFTKRNNLSSSSSSDVPKCRIQ